MHPTIHLMHGFIGFGKTTIAKRLADETSAVRFTHDEWMIKAFGRNPEDFSKERFDVIDERIKDAAAIEIQNGRSVIMDYGFWEKETRKKYFEWAKSLTPNVIFHAVQCDLTVAKKRAFLRTEENKDEFVINEEIFFDRLKRFEPMTKEEGYPTVFYQTDK